MRWRAAAGDPRLLMGAVQGAAMALLKLGRIPEARARLMEAIAIADANGDRYTQAFQMTSLGFLEARSERREAALECFAAAVDLPTKPAAGMRSGSPSTASR